MARGSRSRKAERKLAQKYWSTSCSDNILSGMHSLGELDPEYEQYIKKLPKDKQGELSDQDKVAIAAFGKASAAIMGPAGPAFVGWFAGGGAVWMQNAVMSVLPNKWKAQGVFDWISYVIEPTTVAAGKIDQSIRLAADETQAYTLLLKEKGLVAPGKPIPLDLRWFSLQKYAAQLDPLAGKGKAPKRFYEYVMNIAFANGYGKRYDLSIDPQKMKTFAVLDSYDECLKKTKDWKFAAYCVRLSGLPSRANEDEKKYISRNLTKAIENTRLKPLRDALVTALDTVDEVIRRKSGKRRVPKLSASYLARVAAEKKAKELAEKRAKEAAARKAKELAEKKAREAAAQRTAIVKTSQPLYTDNQKALMVLLFAFAAGAGAFVIWKNKNE